MTPETEAKAIQEAAAIFRMIEIANDVTHPESDYYRDKVYEYCNDMGGEE